MANDDLDKIERLHALRKQDLLSEEEFSEEKRKLLSGHWDATSPPENTPAPNPKPIEENAPDLVYLDEADSRHPNRRVLWATLGIAAVVAAVAAYLMFASNKNQNPQSPEIVASGTPPLAIASTSLPSSTLEQVSTGDFKGQDEIPHCTLSNSAGVPVFLSAIMMDGSRGAIVKRGGKVVKLSLAGAPNRFSGANGGISAAVDYDKSSVRNVGEDEIKFAGKLVVTADGKSESQPISATCYGSDFDESWAGNSNSVDISNDAAVNDTSIEPSIIGDPSLSFSKNFPNGTETANRGTWAKDRNSCSNSPSAELINISSNRISAFNENGEIIQGKKHRDYVEYTTKFILDGRTWYRDFLLRGQTGNSFTLSSIAYDNEMGTGKRVPMADTEYIRC